MIKRDMNWRQEGKGMEDVVFLLTSMHFTDGTLDLTRDADHQR